MTAMAPATSAEAIDLTRWGITIAVPAIAGLFGVWIGSLLATRREQKQRRLSFLERQLQEFYSALLGIRTDIRVRSEIRVTVGNAASALWPEICERARGNGGAEALRQITDARWPEFERLIEYDNKQLVDDLLPLYRQMVERFRTHYWLAEPDTRAFYPQLVEFVELWNRWLDKSLPAEVLERLGHGEDNLKDFYAHLEQKHDELREKVRLADV